MSLEQTITETNAILISIRDLLLSGNLTTAPKVETEQKAPPKPAKKVQAKPVEDKPEVTPKAEPIPAPAQPAQVPETATATPTHTPTPTVKAEPTEQEAIQCLLDLAKKDRNAAVTVLAQFGVGKAIDVPLEKRAEFIDALKSKLAEVTEV